MPGGYGAAAELLGDRRTRPTGLVGVCDEVAVGAIIAARRLGIRVPDQLSVVGIDDHAYAEMFSLTTIQQKPHQQGRAAVQLLVAARTVRPSVIDTDDVHAIDLDWGTDTIRTQLLDGKSAGEIVGSWQPGVTAFLPLRERFLLYS